MTPPPPPDRPWYQKKRWWVLGVVAVLFIIGAVAGGNSTDDSDPAASEGTSSAEDEPKDEPKSEPQDEPKSESEDKPKAEPKALRVQAGQMLKEFEGNEAAADAKYKGKVLQVTGHVAKVNTEFLDDDQYIVQLDGGGDFAILSVNCNDVSAEQAAKVQADSTTTVRGKFDDGGDLGVEIKDCKVL